MKEIKLKMVLIGLTILLSSSFVYGLMFIGDFSQGFFQNTVYNGSTLKLTSGSLTGLFISSVFDAGNTTNWTTITWDSTELGEMNNNQQGNLSKDNLLLYHLDEQSGPILDYSGNGLNATQYGGVSYNRSGKIGTALSFDGVNDYLGANDISSFTNQLSFGGWFKRGSATWQYLFGQSGKYYLLLDANPNYIYCDVSNATTTQQTTAVPFNTNDGNWHQVFCIYNSSNIILYVDGNRYGTTPSLTGNVATGNKPVGIGALSSGSGNFFNGSIDEVAIWNRSLTSNEIKDLYRRGISKLNLSINGCEDSNCTNSNWTSVIGKSPQNISITNKRYFQYKLYFETTNSTLSPEVYSLSVGYILNNQTNQTNQTENPPEQNNPLIEGGSSGGTNTADEQKPIVVFSYSKEELTKQILSIVIGVLIFVGLIVFLIYLVIKVAR